MRNHIKEYLKEKLQLKQREIFFKIEFNKIQSKWVVCMLCNPLRDG